MKPMSFAFSAVVLLMGAVGNIQSMTFCNSDMAFIDEISPEVFLNQDYCSSCRLSSPSETNPVETVVSGTLLAGSPFIPGGYMSAEQSFDPVSRFKVGRLSGFICDPVSLRIRNCSWII